MQPCDFIRKFGSKIGWPLQSLALAQLLYHLGSKLNILGNNLESLCLCIYVAGKMTDTHKRLRDTIQQAHSHLNMDLDSDVLVI